MWNLYVLWCLLDDLKDFGFVLDLQQTSPISQWKVPVARILIALWRSGIRSCFSLIEVDVLRNGTQFCEESALVIENGFYVTRQQANLFDFKYMLSNEGLIGQYAKQ